MDDRELIQRLTETEDRSKSNTKRINELQKRQDDLQELTTAIAVVKNEQENLAVDVGEIKEDVKSIKEKPSKRWESIVTAVIGAIVGYVMAMILKGGV